MITYSTFIKFFQASIAALLLLSLACHHSPKSQNYPDHPKGTVSATQVKKEFGERYFISGDFNGDKIIDTIFESYISRKTRRETYKTLDANDQGNNLELIVANEPVSRLYSSTGIFDTFVVTDNSQQAGVFLLANVGDINGDHKDEFGYAVSWVDFSSLNTYHLMTVDSGRVKEIFRFQIHELMSLEPENLISNNSLVKIVAPGTIEYAFLNDDVEIEIGRHSF
jgi:hypothetical protein